MKKPSPAALPVRPATPRTREFVIVPIGELHEDTANARRHGDRNLEAIKNSLRAFGQVLPIVIAKDGRVVAGNGRLRAARELGWPRVQCIRVDDWTDAQAAAYALADNRTAELADWDDGALARALAGLPRDLRLETGFDAREVADLLAAERLRVAGPNIDDVPLPPEAATTRKGDLWILGKHRLLCGDSTSPADLDRLRDGQPIHLVNTDPPYNVNVEPRSRNAVAAGLTNFGAPATHHQKFDAARDPRKGKKTDVRMRAKDRPLANDFVSDAAFDRLLGDWFGNIARVLLPGRGFYCWGGYANCGNYPPAFLRAGLYFSQAIIWVKNQPVLTRKDFMGAHEWCFYGWREGAAHVFLGPNNARDVWRTRKTDDAALVALSAREAALASRDVWEVTKVNARSMVHLTEKPVELASRAVLYSSRRGENVLDLFGGSGSTLMACEEADRRAHLMELDPLYADVIVERWQKFTGKNAVLAGTSDTFAKVAGRRRSKRG